LKVKLLGNNAGTPATKPNPEAYNAYLQGRYFFRQSNKASFEKSVDYFKQAIQIDPRYALAWVGLAKSFYGQADAGYIPDKDGYQKAREAAERALQVDPNLGEAHAALGWITMHYDWNWAFSDASYRRALELDPENVAAIGAAGVLSATLGRLDEAIEHFREVIEIDPLNPVAYRNIGNYLYYAGRPQEAIAALKKALELTPALAIAHGILGEVYLAQAQPQAALAEMQKEKDPELRLQGLALAYQALGRKQEADASLAEFVGKFADDPYYISEVYAFRGEKDRAFEWLQKAYAARDSGLTEIKGDPLLKNLEHDPRYAALLKKMGLPL
jgi:tetratricopeptide (TPR) repeat protein